MSLLRQSLRTQCTPESVKKIAQVCFPHKFLFLSLQFFFLFSFNAGARVQLAGDHDRFKEFSRWSPGLIFLIGKFIYFDFWGHSYNFFCRFMKFEGFNKKNLKKCYFLFKSFLTFGIFPFISIEISKPSKQTMTCPSFNPFLHMTQGFCRSTIAPTSCKCRKSRNWNKIPIVTGFY